MAGMTAAFLGASAAIAEEELPNSAAYLQGWIDALKSKHAKGWIVRAAAQAQKAAGSHHVQALSVTNTRSGRNAALRHSALSGPCAHANKRGNACLYSVASLLPQRWSNTRCYDPENHFPIGQVQI